MKAYLQLYIEGNRIDLFTDESINMVQSIQNIKDISQVFVEFSRSFDVPASKNNNKVFKHYYNYSIKDGFDARLKKTATLEINHRPFKDGKIRLDGVDMVDGSPNSYRITFFGNTITLNDLLGDDDLSGLELSTFDTDYTAANVKTALTGGITYTFTDPQTSATTPYPNAIIAPLISHTQRFYYSNSAGTAYSDTATIQNIKWDSDLHAGVYYEQLKFGLRVHAIIEAIERKYGITFSEDFLYPNNPPYYDLYLWLHRKKGTAFEANEISKQITGFTIDRHTSMTNVRSEANELIISGLTETEVRASLTVTSTTSITATIKVLKNGLEINNGTRTMTNATSITLTSMFLENGSYKVYILSEETSFTLSTATEWALDLIDGSDQATYALTGTFSFTNTRRFIIAEQIPEMKVIDFLTGLFKMFNLTAYEDGGTIIVKSLENYYADSNVVWDITKYVDQNSGTVDVALPYKEVEFKFEGLETKLAKQHNQISNQSWGTEHYRGDDYYDAAPSTYSVVVPFEHMKYERLKEVVGGVTTSIQVGWFVDDNSDPYFGKPLLFYAEVLSVSGNSISYLTDKTSTKEELTGNVFMPINSVSTDSSVSESSLNFRNEINEYTNTNAFSDTLFLKYYKSYIQDVFTLDRRLTTVTAYLPIKVLQEINLADTLAIFDRNYTINTLETDFKTGVSKIEMINELTVSIGGSTPITTTTTTDEDVCTECSADSTLCTVDNLTPTADKTCDVGRTVTISGVTSADNTDDITLTATANNFIGTPTYAWSGGSASGTSAAITFTEATATGYIVYTCTATDDSDSSAFSKEHTVLWSPKKYTITLNVVNNITGPAAGYAIGGDQTGATKSLVSGAEYFFNTTVTANTGYVFTSGPTVTNASGTVATADATVNTTLTGAVQATNAFVAISGATARTIGNQITLLATLSGISGTDANPITYTWSGGAASGSSASVDITETTVTQPTRPVTVTYKCTVTGVETATGSPITTAGEHEVNWSDLTLITITLAIDATNIAGPAAGFTITGDQHGLEKTQNSGTVFNFTSDVELNQGYEWVGDKPSVDNAGGTYGTSQTVTTTFGAGTAQLIVYNYYIATGCSGTSVAGQTIYIRSRGSFTVGSSSTGSSIKINGNCYYASSTTTASTWGENDGVTVGNAEYVGCAACTDTEATTADPCLLTKSKINLRYASTNIVCESATSELFYYINGADDSVSFCNATNLYTYTDCTVNAPAGHYSLVRDNTKRRYWNGTAFSVCVNCLDANYLFYMGIGWNPFTQYCDDAQGIGGYYYFDNNKSLTSATPNDKMYANASDVGTNNFAPEGFYTDGDSFYRYYEPQSLQVWEDYGECLPKPPDPDPDPSKPTLSVWRQYSKCVGSGTLIFGNNTDSFPASVKSGSTCYGDPTSVTGSQSDNWIDATTSGANDYEHFNSCDECTDLKYYRLKRCSDNNQNFRSGQDTTSISLSVNDRVTADGVTYIVLGSEFIAAVTSVGNVTDTGLSGCTDAPSPDNVFTVTRQSDGETTYVQVNDTNLVGDENITISTDGANCYDIVGSENVSDATVYGVVTGTCTTTTTTTTTTVVCGGQTLYTSTASAQNACCNLSSETIYMNSRSITSATKIYTALGCSSELSGTKYFTADLINYYTWNGSSLSGPTACPTCGNQP